MMQARWPTLAIASLALLLGTAGGAIAQELTGNIFGSVADESGEPLPGVTVTASGIGADKLQVTDAMGQFRFLRLDPGNYLLTAALEGFSTVEYAAVNVRVGRNTTVDISMSSAIQETITVTSESPLLDERKVQAGTTISRIELEKIPTARDPWAVVTQTPGVLSDRINVGGNESGQQAVFLGPGQQSSENTFSVDGVVITDMAAIGASPTYYDFDQFSEFQIATGGTDVTNMTAGVRLNLVTKRGVNEPRGSGRYMRTDADDIFGIGLDQAEPDISLPPEQVAAEGQLAGNEIDSVLDVGFEAGGAFIRDRLWGWGSYGRSEIGMITANGLADDTLLENSALKLNAQIVPSNSAVASFNRGDKIKKGRNIGPTRSPASSWDQEGPTEIYKVEDTHVFGANFYLRGLYSYVDGGFQLIPKGGLGAEARRDSSGVWQDAYLFADYDRNMETWELDGSWFFNLGETSHELKFGLGRRVFDTDALVGWPGERQMVHYACENLGLCGLGELFGLPGPDADLFWASRYGNNAQEQTYESFWVQDTLSWDRLTVNVGLRYDLQDGKNLPGLVPANNAVPGFPMPELDFPGNDANGIEFESLSPRVGVTYALGEERATLLRASYAEFTQQLYTSAISRLNPLGTGSQTFVFHDANGNEIWDGAEEPFVFLATDDYDITDPTSLATPNRNDRGLDGETTREFLLGVEHAFLPEFVVSLNYVYRLTDDKAALFNLIDDPVTGRRVATAADYELDRTREVALPDGSTTTVNVYSLVHPFAGGTLLTNSDREVEYNGFTLSAIKRLSNRWMVRAYLAYGEPEWKIGSRFRAFDDPGDLTGDIEEQNVSMEDTSGNVFAEQSTGSGNKEDVWIQSTWSFNVNGLYQLPKGFNVAASISGREGYPLPYHANLTPPDGITREVAAPVRNDRFRTDDIYTVDLRLEKEVTVSADLGLTLSLDAFNLLNNNDVLQRERNLTGPRPSFVDETISPRIYRLGFRIDWR